MCVTVVCTTQKRNKQCRYEIEIIVILRRVAIMLEGGSLVSRLLHEQTSSQVTDPSTHKESTVIKKNITKAAIMIT